MPFAESPSLVERVSRTRSRAPSSLVASVALLAGSFAFRLPPLLNARSTNSDAAVVGLQAMHVLRGEISPLLWGSGYQTSADAIVAAAFFAVLGPTPFALTLSALSLHVLATWLVFTTLRRHVPPWSALLATMPLVVTPPSVHTYALYPPRQASITLALAAFAAIDRAAAAELELRPPSERATRLWLALGGTLATLAVSADPYPMLLVPLVGLFALLVAASPAASPSPLRLTSARLGPFLVGGALGLVPFTLIHRLAGAKSGPMGLTTEALAHHAKLLVDECLPWALSYKIYFAWHVMDYAPWTPPTPVRIVQLAGAGAVFAVVVFAIVATFVRRWPWPVRRLGLVGALTYPLAIAAFLVSVMVMDHFSMRYLAVLTLMLPFAIAPLTRAIGRGRAAIVIGPHLCAAAICGWIGYGPFVGAPSSALPVRETPELADDYVLRDLLHAHGVRYATADYWASYRLTLLYAEDIVVVPTNAREDRYAPYRHAFEAAPLYAYVFDPGRSRENLTEAKRDLVAANASVEETHAGGLTVFIVRR